MAYVLALKSLLAVLPARFVPLLHFLFSVKVCTKFFIELLAFHDETPLYLHVSPNYTVDDLEPLLFSEKAKLAHVILYRDLLVFYIGFSQAYEARCYV